MPDKTMLKHPSYNCQRGMLCPPMHNIAANQCSNIKDKSKAVLWDKRYIAYTSISIISMKERARRYGKRAESRGAEGELCQ